jgi:ankyrin repeat protein
MLSNISAQLYTSTLVNMYAFLNLQGRTPLHIAVLFSHTQLFEILMEKGAEPNCRDNNVSTNYI